MAVPIFSLSSHISSRICAWNGYIQGGGRLICDKKSWLAGYCHGNHHSLAHTARKLVRIFLHPLLRRCDSQLFSERPQLLSRLLFLPQFWWSMIGSISWVPIVRVGFRGSHWIPKNHGNIISADPAHLFLRKPYQFFFHPV